jgi:hypothetical protein
MMHVDVTCRYCHRKLDKPQDIFGDLPGREEEYLFECTHCVSLQCFRPDGQSTHYQFTKFGKYSFCFNPIKQSFRLLRLPDGTIKTTDDLNRKPIIELGYLPHQYTPTTVNEERLKTIILFS